MARMIPPGYLQKTPVGEKELFKKLRDDPDTSNWVVLHSLEIKKHLSKIEGELDMVIFVPNFGVLCIEVKGCEVSRQDGVWIYPYGTSYEGPFKQASKAMHSLREYLLKRDSSLSGILFFSAAVFTLIDFDETSPEWHEWQYINRRQFLRQPISQSIRYILERAHAHVDSKTSRYSWYDSRTSKPTEPQTRKMVSLLRENFEYIVSARNDIERLETNIRRFTEEQYDALDYLQDNDRIVFKGPAGTGKTFLAIETAKRALNEGRSVLFLCFNHLLGEWLKTHTASLTKEGSGFYCGTFHSLLVAITGQKTPQPSAAEYWQITLPCIAADKLLSDDRSWPSYDMLIVDEAQDLTSEEYLDVLDLLLVGGLAGGSWALFGDFERQAIYASGEANKNFQKALGMRAPNHANYSLRINCRNAEPIAEILCITSGLTPGYKQILHGSEGAEVDPLFYLAQSDQNLLLTKALGELLKTFKPSEIAILSMRSDSDSCAGNLNSNEIGFSIEPARKLVGAQSIPFASIHAFKGLEASAIIITDIDTLDDERSRALLYVGMSRARVRLYMLMHEGCRKSYNNILDSGLAIISGR